MIFNLGAAEVADSYEPNALNEPDGLQPNASGFYKYFTNSDRKSEFSMMCLEVMANYPG